MRSRVAGLMLAMWIASLAVARADILPGQYQVTTGDNMTRIARRFGVSVKALRQANPNIDEQHLGIGAVLNIPKCDNHAVATGDTLYSVAHQYNVSVDNLKTLNHLSGDHVTVGQTLAIPPPQPVPPQVPVHVTVSTAAPGPMVPAGTWVSVRLADGTVAWAPRDSLLMPSSTPLNGPQIVALARKLAGTPFVWGGTSPNGADCSGFVQTIYSYAGYQLPRTADVQFEATREVPTSELQPGDLVFFTTYLPGPSHVGIYVGDGRFIHASSSQGVTESSLSDAYFAPRFLGGHRLPQFMPPEPPTAAAPSPSSTASEPSSTAAAPSPASPPLANYPTEP